MHSRPSSVRLICSPLTTAITWSVLEDGRLLGLVAVATVAAGCELPGCAAAGCAAVWLGAPAGWACRVAGVAGVDVMGRAGPAVLPGRTIGACAAASCEPSRRIARPAATTAAAVPIFHNQLEPRGRAAGEPLRAWAGEPSMATGPSSMIGTGSIR